MSNDKPAEGFQIKLPFLCPAGVHPEVSTSLLNRSLHFVTLLALARIKETGNSDPDVAGLIDREMGKFTLQRNVTFQQLVFKDRLIPLEELFGRSYDNLQDLMIFLEGYRSLLVRLANFGHEQLIDNTDIISDFIQFISENYSAELCISDGSGFRIIGSTNDMGSTASVQEGNIYLVKKDGENPLCLHPLIFLKEPENLMFFEGVDLDGIRYNSVRGPSVENSHNLLKSFRSFFLQSGAFRSALFVSKKIKNDFDDDSGHRFTAYCYNGLQYFIQGRYHLSVSAFEKAFEIDNTMPVLYYHLAQCYGKMKDSTRSAAILRRLVSYHPNQSRAFELLGDMFMDRNERAKAAKLFGRVLSLNPLNASVERKLKIAGRPGTAVSVGEDRPAVSPEDKDTEVKSFLIDLTEEAKKGRIQKIIGCKSELLQLEEVLSCRNKRNAMVLGETGVGKTALVEELANRIISGEITPTLRGMTIYKMSVASVLAGAKYRGQFEERMLKMLNELRKERCILFIDDIQTIIGSGLSKGGSMDTSSIIKPALLNGDIQVVGTCNFEDYRVKVEKEPSLERCFQIIRLDEPDLEKTMNIVSHFRTEFENFHGVKLGLSLLQETLPVIDICIKDRYMPDKALDIYDRAAVKASIRTSLNESYVPEVSVTDVYQTISDISGIPVEKVAGMKDRKLKELEKTFKKRIIGQDAAVGIVSRAMRTGRLNLGMNSQRPDGVYLFLGPTGVGKTELAKAMSEALFGDEKHLIRIDMSEYMEKISSSRLIGTSPGYVGYNDQNQLTDLVRKNPYSVVLLDEIEKADSQMINLFLQVFDAGRLTDGRGRTVSFSHTTFVMTSNLGTDLYSKNRMGYNGGNKHYHDVSRNDLMKQLRKYFPPEFLNRLDEIVIFNPLDRTAFRDIAALRLSELAARISFSGKRLIFDESVIDYIAGLSFNTEYGARNLEREIRREILDALAEKSLDSEWENCGEVLLWIDEGVLKLDIRDKDRKCELLEEQDISSCNAKEDHSE